PVKKLSSIRTQTIALEKGKQAVQKRLRAVDQQARQTQLRHENSERCAACGKAVYQTERLSVESIVFHKSCCKCGHCSWVLKLGNYAALDGKYYCKPHFKQLFASKGNYNEAFGKKKIQQEWAERAGQNNNNTPTPSPSLTN